MAKIDPVSVGSQYLSVEAVNANFDAIAAELQDKVLYRDNPVGEPNQMENSLDMNSNRILNLPEPESPNEAARLQDVIDALAGGSADLISFDPTGTIEAGTVQEAIEEVAADAATDLAAHIADTDSAHAASAVSFSPSTIVAEDVQAAIEEVNDNLSAHMADATDAHDAVSISYLHPGTGGSARDMQSKAEESVSVFDFMSSAEITDVQAGTALVDTTASLQEALDDAFTRGKAVKFPAGTYLTTGIKVYPFMRVEFDPQAILKMSANGFGIRTLVQPGDSVPTNNIRRVHLISPRVDMNSKEGVGILVECCTDASVKNAYVTNIGSGTFNYNDGLGSDTYTSGGIYLKGINGVYGCYYSHIESPRTNGGGLGIWLGTSSSLRTSKANMNLITNPVCQSSTTGILLYTADDNVIVKPEVSLSTTGIRVGVPGGGVYYCNRNRFTHVYMEGATTGMNITSESSSTVVDGVGSIISTTTPFTDNGFSTAIFYPKRLGTDDYARFYDKEVRGVAGVKFLATQEASSDANTLDDYKEGSFNATIEGTTSAGVGTYSDQTGLYTKVGREIMFDISLQWTAHTGTGDLRVAGLPFTSASGRSIPCSVYIISGLPLASGPVIQGLVAGGATTITLSQYNGTTVAPIPMDTAAFIRISGRYRV